MATQSDRKVLTVEQAAALLGIGRSAAYEAVHRNEIPSLKIGRRLLVPISGLGENAGRCRFRQARCLIEPDTSGVVHHAESPQPAAAIQAAPSFEPTDLGNAERLVAQHGHDLRYVHPWRSWLVWDGRRWKKDDTGEVYRRAKTTVRDIQLEALHAPDETTKRELENHALDSEDERRIKAMVRLAETESRVLVALDEIDAHPWLLNVLNGTIDLRTGVLKEHQPKDLITKLITVDYDPNATAPTFKAFLDRITAETADQQGFLRRAIGYSLTGDTSEQCLFMLHGPGANGKSTLVETILGLLGEYARQSDFSTFLASSKGGDRIRNDIARLQGARFVSAVEVGMGRTLDEVAIKQLTGTDTVTARFLYKEFFEFRPTFKLFLAMNHLPSIRGTDHAIWRRIKVFPMLVTIPSEEMDKRLLEKLKSEYAGILNWALSGCLEWQTLGLGDPEEVQAATTEYRSEMDPVPRFIEDRCQVGPGQQVPSAQLYQAYGGWCEEDGEHPMTKKALGIRLHELGYTRVRIGSEQARGWGGIGLRPASFA